MAMGTRKQRERQEELWYRREMAEAPGDPFYRRLNEVLEQAGFDATHARDWNPHGPRCTARRRVAAGD
jgi:hypothetical protein